MMPFTVPRYSLRLKESIIGYIRLGVSVTQIRKLLMKRHRVRTSCHSLRKFVKLYKESGSIHRRRRPVGCNSKVKPGHIQFINVWISENNEISARQIVDKLSDTFGLFVSISTVKAIRLKLGFTYKKVRYCQMISHPNKHFRLQYSIQWWAEKEDFRNVVFVDESSVEMDTHGRFHFYKRGGSSIGNPTSKRPKPKHPYKVMIWGGISYRGRTSICIFKGIMDSISYQQILERNLIPFGSRMYPEGYRLYQDNDPKHFSKSTMEFYKRNRLTVMKTPASSPDLNPIENVWGSMKDFLLKQVKPTTKDALVNGIHKFWTTQLSPTTCARYIDHIHKVIPKVILLNGEPTGY